MSLWLPAALSALVAFAVFAVTLAGTYIYDDVVVAKADARLHDAWRLMDATSPLSIRDL